MKLEEAVQLLMRKKAKTISSYKARAMTQDMKSIKYWLFKSKTRSHEWESFFNATDWEVES